MRVIKIILQETENDGVEATIEVNPPIEWEERMSTEIEIVAQWVNDFLATRGIKLIHVNQAQG